MPASELDYLQAIYRHTRIMMTTLNDILNDVKQITDAKTAILVTLTAVQKQLADALAKDVLDQNEIQAIHDDLQANAAALAAAAVANTPTQTPPVPPDPHAATM